MEGARISGRAPSCGTQTSHIWSPTRLASCRIVAAPSSGSGASYGIPFSVSSLEVLCSGGGEVAISLESGDAFRRTCQLKVLGIQVDAGGTTQRAMYARELAASRVGFQNDHWFECQQVPIRARLDRLYASAAAAFLYGAGWWTLSTVAWRACQSPMRPSIAGSPRSGARPANTSAMARQFWRYRPIPGEFG